MRILHIINTLSPGGAERFVVELCNRLAKDPNNEVTLAVTDEDSLAYNSHYLGDLSSAVQYICLHSPSGLHPKSVWRTFRLIQKMRPDIVHAHCDVMSLYFPSVLISKVKFVHTLHNLANVVLHKKWSKPINSWLYSGHIKAVTISPTCLRSYEELYHKHNAACIMNGREPLVPSGKRPEDIPSFTDGGKIFIHVARCVPQKNQKRLFRAFDRLSEDGEKFHLLVLGKGYEEKWAVKYKDSPCIHIIGARNNVADYLAVADFFVLSSDFEGLPISLLEAMSLGVIPISTPAGGVVDVIRNGENGWMTTGFGDEEFYQLLRTAISSSGNISRQQLIQEYNAEYSMKTCSERYYALYESLLSSK